MSGTEVGMGLGAPVAKSKTVSILLAVFLGFFTWLYTYKRDSTKFWIGLLVTIFTVGIAYLFIYIWAIVDACIKPDSYYTNFPNG